MHQAARRELEEFYLHPYSTRYVYSLLDSNVHSDVYPYCMHQAARRVLEEFPLQGNASAALLRQSELVLSLHEMLISESWGKLQSLLGEGHASLAADVAQLDEVHA